MLLTVFLSLSLIIPLTVQLLILALNRGEGIYTQKVSAPTGCTILGWSCYALTAVLFIVLCITETGFAVKLISFAAAVFALLFITMSQSLYIGYDKNGFVIRKFFISKQYKYQDIDSVIESSLVGYKLRVKGRKNMVDDIMVGNLEFLDYADRRYNLLKGSDIPREKMKLFNGHVKEPVSTFIILLIIPLGLSFFSAWFCFELRTPNEYPQDLIEIKAEICSTEKHLFETLLICPEGELSMANVSGKNKILNNFKPEREYLMLIEPWRGENGKNESEVWAIADEAGNYLFTSEDTFKAEVRLNHTVNIIFILAALVSWPLFFFNYHALSHPDKHPLCVKLLIKKEYIC